MPDTRYAISAVYPADFRCPVLWLVGSEDPDGMTSIDECKEKLAASSIRLQVLDGFDHMQVFEAIDLVFPFLLDFTHPGGRVWKNAP